MEITEITRTRPLANFMIAANHYPRSNLQERRCWGKKIGFPRDPVVAVRTASTAVVIFRARALTVEIVADVNDKVRSRRRSALGQHRERPLCVGITVLEFAIVPIGVGWVDLHCP